MSLIDEYRSPVCFLEKTRVPDGEGGFSTTWEEGASFSAAVTLDTSIEARVGEKQGVTSVYTITTDKHVILEYHDVLKRMYDGKVFRVTSDGEDKYTPESSALNIRQVTAEEWSLPK